MKGQPLKKAVMHNSDNKFDKKTNKFNIIRALFRKEITDVLRDKKTLIMMILVPLILYPLLIVIMSLVMNAMTGTSADKTYKIAFSEVPVENAQAIEALIRSEATETDFEFLVLEKTLAGQELMEQTVHVYVTVDDASNYIIHYLSAENDSGLVAGIVMDSMELYLAEMQIKQVEERGLDQKEILHPITFEAQDQSTTEESMGNIIGGAIPLFMIISIVMGAMYPAIDVTAGEKERGTLETLITLPVTNFEMIISKFFAVAVVTVVSALLNLISMGVALGFMGGMVLAGSGMESINLVNFLPAVVITVVVMIFFALFVTAVSIFVCLFAKSFKEANNYITPVMLVFMMTSYTGMLPNFELSTITAGIPIVNVVLMVKQLFQMDYDYALFGIVLISNAVYSFLMMWLLARVYNSETVLFGEGFSGVRIFEKRSEIKSGQLPGYGDIILLICAVFLLTFYVGGVAQVHLGVGGVAITQAIMLLVPLLYAWYLKSDWRRLFSVKTPQLRHLIGSVILWIGCFCLVMVLSMVLMPLLPESTQNVNDAFAIFNDLPPVLVWLIMALMPAIGEELMFRGFVFGTLKNRGGVKAAMVISSIIFALFHMSLVKLPTTFVLGFFIVLAVKRSGSIFTGMLIHLLNNTLSVLMMTYPDLWDNIPLIMDESITVSEGMVITMVGMMSVALGLFIIGRKKN
ncbi:MAG: ABC transporter permease subunit [Lachnospiraceae bacterium]|jgi:sodium transport system permease protein|nr:ABC transporter permease subunit [Lachnospiraceae bacterium]